MTLQTRTGSALAAALALALSACGPGLPGDASSPAEPPASTEPPATARPSSTSADPPSPPSGPTLRPAPAAAHDDKPAAYALGCQNEGGTEVLRCEVGDPDGRRTVALVGDSKALQWVSALDTIGQENGWQVVVMTKSGCPWADALVVDEECHEWGRGVTDALLDLEPDLVVTSGVKAGAAPVGSPQERSAQALAEGYVAVWDRLAAKGVPVAALSDTPQPGRLGDVPTCVGEHLDDPEACALPYGRGSGTDALLTAAGQARGATFVDLGPVLCPGGTCPATFGDVLIYRQGSHITDTFARTVIPSLEPVLVDLVGTPG